MATTKYGSLELHFDATISGNTTLEIQTNIYGLPSFEAIGDESVAGLVSIQVKYETDPESEKIYFVCYTLIGGEIANRSDYICDVQLEDETSWKVFFADSRVSVYVNDKSVYSYIMQGMQYPDEIDPEVSIMAIDDDTTIFNIVRVELCDTRDAVFIDYENTADNAISSVIQERPIEIYPAVGRALEFSYNILKDIVYPSKIKKYTKTRSIPNGLSSDGIVYGRDVSMSNNDDTAYDFGLITRMYRMPDLNTGVKRAVRTTQKKLHQSTSKIEMISRFDPKFQAGDQCYVELIVTGTQTPVEESFIIEGISFSVSDGVYSQTVTGRKS